MKPINAIIFDLDGTLFHTLPHLHRTMNHCLAAYNRPPIDFDTFRGHADKGRRDFIKASFQVDDHYPHLAEIESTYTAHTIANVAKECDYFPGIRTLLNQLTQHHIPWGVMTNRPQFLAEPIVKHFDLASLTPCLVYGDTLATAKPHPEPLLLAAELLNVAPEHAVYVGDTENDMIAAQRANMQRVLVRYGYLRAESDPKHPVKIIVILIWYNYANQSRNEDHHA